MDIRIHVLHVGKICLAPQLAFGRQVAGVPQVPGAPDAAPGAAETQSQPPTATRPTLREAAAASGIFARRAARERGRIWLPVSAYLIEHPRGLVLVDTGWSRSMSPQGTSDERAQVRSLGSRLLHRAVQGVVERGQTVPEQLEALGVAPEKVKWVLLTSLDASHANGLADVAKWAPAARILVSADELAGVRADAAARVRYQRTWWQGAPLEAIEWNGTEGPAGCSFDLFGDGSVVCVGIPGRSAGQVAVKVTGEDGRFVLLCADGAHSERQWRRMELSGLAADRAQQRASLKWIREQALDPRCEEVLASHDPAVRPHVAELLGLPARTTAPARPAGGEGPESAPGARAPQDNLDGLDGLDAGDLKATAGKVAVAAMLASTLTATHMDFGDFQLPAATPLVQAIDSGGSDLAPDLAPDADQDTSKSSVWDKIFKILKQLLAVFAFLVACILASLKGCAACGGQLCGAPLEHDEDRSGTTGNATPAIVLVVDALHAAAG